MYFVYKIEGGWTAALKPGTRGSVDELPESLKPLLFQLINKKTSDSLPNLSRPDECRNELTIEKDQEVYKFQYPDSQIPDDIRPLFDYLRKRAFERK